MDSIEELFFFSILWALFIELEFEIYERVRDLQ